MAASGPRFTDQKSSPVAPADQGEGLSFGSCRFDRGKDILYRDGVEVALPPKAVSILECLLDRPGRVVPKQELIDRVWSGTVVTDHSRNVSGTRGPMSKPTGAGE